MTSTSPACYRCGQHGHVAAACIGGGRPAGGNGGSKAAAVGVGVGGGSTPSTSTPLPSLGGAAAGNQCGGIDAPVVVSAPGATSGTTLRGNNDVAVRAPRGGAAQPQEAASSHITDVEGDLMSSPDALCHCVSECLAMGKGIAVLFKDRFQGVDALKAQGIKVGGVAVLDRTLEADRRFVYYLVTKPRYFHKPSYQSLASSLAAMFQHMTAHGVTRVAMPEIGCGLDMLEWPKVRDMLETMLRGSDIHVTVFHFRPQQKPQRQQQQR